MVEAANETLVTQRMKRSGMRWRIAGGQAVLTFRALIKSARFDRAWKAIIGATDTPAIFERQGQVYTEIVPDCSKPTLQGIIRGRVDPRTVINSDGWRGYNGLVDLGYGHFRVDHSRDEFTKAPFTSTASRASGGWPRSAWRSSRASLSTPSTCTSRKPNGDITTDTPTNTKLCYDASAKTRSARQDPKQF